MLRLPVMVAAGGINSAGRTSRRHAYRRMIWDHLSVPDQTATAGALAQMMGTADAAGATAMDVTVISTARHSGSLMYEQIKSFEPQPVLTFEGASVL